uniref:NADH-ubiquinone oxidoreductase chain 5 n=1 Tax=Mantella madagascariensis TaxID=111290 RepID=Q2HXI2_9NEOB|nr:NADH dehydrogenase subunit 5 [Mantella madagascariensis]BAE79513.1 NADH dehydrogenase subunit 5 [Mantella madagascariensis]
MFNLLPTISISMVIFTLISPLLFINSPNFPTYTKKAVKTAFFISLLALLSLTSQNQENTNNQKEWINSFFTNMKFSVYFDSYAIMFLPVALFVTWSILEFSIWYMEEDMDKNRFMKYLLIFLLAMLTLTSAGNFFMLFIGWEGVGLMSFLLIGWYHGRNNAATAASQAVLYNRVGDIGFLMAFCWFINTLPSTEHQTMIVIPPTYILLALITAAATKSAQFTFHPWLASAMEGPTPVSALLHSSTMVVAGVFLLIRMFPLLEKNQTALSVCLCLGALTTFYAAMLALSQNDIKKIVAYSTSSQLGLMMVAIGIGQPHLAFLHICTHAFFKAMLFLCSGSIIHNLNDEQDIRKMGGLQMVMPVTTSCFSIGSLALMGTPFLAGFYSKDAIIETASISHINLMALILTLIATAFTAVYSFRLVYYISMKSPRSNPLLKFNENNTPVLNSITRLAIGSIIAGLLIFHITFPNNPAIHTMPIYMKMAAILFTIIGFIIAFDLAKMNWNLPPSNNSQSKFFDPAHYNQIMHRPVTATFLDIGWKIVTHIMDDLLVKKLSRTIFKDSNITPIQIVRASQSGMIKAYLSTLFTTMLFVLTFIYFI